MTRISVAGPSITQKEVDYVADAVRTAWYGNSNAFHDRFERAFAAQTPDVVDHICAGVQRSAHHRGLVGIDGKRYSRRSQRFDYRNHALELFVEWHGRRARTRRFPANIDNVSAVANHVGSLRERSVTRDETAAIGKRIRRYVENAHDQRTLEGQREAAALKRLRDSVISV